MASGFKMMGLNYISKLYLEFYTNVVNSVYGSYSNFTGSLSQGKSTSSKYLANCPKKYFKSILMSNKLFWKKGIDLGPFSYESQKLVDQRKDDIFIGNRKIPYERDPTTDPESYSDEKNPFSDQHPPRIYLSLGTRANDKPEIFKGIMTVLGQ